MRETQICQKTQSCHSAATALPLGREIWICEHCAIAVNNDDISGLDYYFDEAKAEAFAKAIEEGFARLGWITTTAEIDDRSALCDCCQNEAGPVMIKAYAEKPEAATEVAPGIDPGAVLGALVIVASFAFATMGG